MTESKKPPLVRRLTSYIFIIAVFSILASALAFFIQLANRAWFHFNYSDWSIIDWWTYISIFFFIGTLLAFLSPFIVEHLTVWLQYRVNKMVAKTKVYQKKLESKIQEKEKKYITSQE